MLMQILRDTQALGRFFPQGARVKIHEKHGRYFVSADPESFTIPCEAPRENLVPLEAFRVLLLNAQIGTHEQDVWGLNEEDVRSGIHERAPDCLIVKLSRLDRAPS